MNNMELMWIYRHAWRGAGLCYRKGDHVVTQESQGDKPSSMFKAMTMYPAWDKWIMPRCDAIPQRYIDDPERWNLSDIDDVRAPQEIPPLGRVRWEHLLLDQLSHEQGNLFRLWYEDSEPYERSFWHAFMHRASLKQEYRWEDHCKEIPKRVTGAVSATSSQETTSGQLQPMEVSTTTQSQGDVSGRQPVQEPPLGDQPSQGMESRSSQQQSSQDTAQVGTTQSPPEQSSTQRMDRSEEPPQQAMSRDDEHRQGRTEKLTRIMLESIHSHDIGLGPAAEMIYKAVLKFATF